MKESKLDQRIRRADELALTYPFAAEVLRFYKHLARLQRGLYIAQQEANDGRSGRKCSRLAEQDLDLDFLLPRFPEFLSAIGGIAPDPLARCAQSLKVLPANRWGEMFCAFWRTAPDLEGTIGAAEFLLVGAFLQPYAEFLADHRAFTNEGATAKLCPFCHAKPLVGVLRQEGDGAKRSLICSSCLTEWNYGRILCPGCGEQAVEKLGVYTAEQFPHMRVEACDTCRRYIKTVDLTKNGLAVPLVDELATLPLNLWAQEHGYVKVQPNLLGI